jgi:hypothetical protein
MDAALQGRIAGVDRKVIFQGLHQLMSSEFGDAWNQAEERVSRIVFIGVGLPMRMFVASLEQCVIEPDVTPRRQIMAVGPARPDGINTSNRPSLS